MKQTTLLPGFEEQKNQVLPNWEKTEILLVYIEYLKEKLSTAESTLDEMRRKASDKTRAYTLQNIMLLKKADFALSIKEAAEEIISRYKKNNQE